MHKLKFGLLMMTLAGQSLLAEDLATFNAYVDSDICSHLMIGVISDPRTECTRSTYKDGSLPVLVRLRDNFVFEIDKTKMVKEHVAAFVEANGEPKEKDGRIKLKSVRAVDRGSLPTTGSESRLLDVRQYKLSGQGAQVAEKVRHELAMMPYITEYDYISFALIDTQVILSGWTVRITNRSTAYNLVKGIEGVEQVTNNIEVLPMGRNDMQIRASARANLQRMLSRYFWGNGSDIKIIVKNGDIILLGHVATKADSDIAYIQCNQVRGAFKVFNLLKVTGTQPGKQG